MTTDLRRTQASSWTPEELVGIRDGLEGAVKRLTSEIEAVVGSIAAPPSGGADVLHDELDVASQRAELLQDSVQAQNLTAILEQTQHVLDRLSGGFYGVCEGCTGEIGRPRLEAFPRATMCMGCAH